jgi:hypothetical protein
VQCGAVRKRFICDMIVIDSGCNILSNQRKKRVLDILKV